MRDYIAAMPFLWLAVDDAPGPDSDRGAIEAGEIALPSNLNRPPIDAASANWLGRFAHRRLIRNTNHMYPFVHASEPGWLLR